jgi:outer membrane protein
MSRLMVRILFAALLMAAFVITQADAQTSTTPASTSIAPAKIAWINLDQMLLTCDEGVKIFGDIQKWVDLMSDKSDALRAELDNLKKELSMQGPKLLDEIRMEKEEKIEEKEIALQRFQQDTRKEIDSKRDKATSSMAKKLTPIIERVAKEKGFNIVQVFNSSRDAWIDKSLFITEDVIKAYNQDNPVAGSKAPASTPAKKP